MEIDFLRQFLNEYNMSREEFDSMVREMEKDQISFILDEKNCDIGKKKNLVKTIYQGLLSYKKSNFIANKPELDHLRLIFLGTAAGGTVLSQKERTGGFILESGTTRIHVDTGPSAVKDCVDYSVLSQMDYNPILTDALLLTHNHIDHSGGAEEYVETMTFSNLLSATKSVIGNKTVMEGNPDFDQGPRLDKYRKAKLKLASSMNAGDSVKIDDITIRATKALHTEAYDPISKRESRDHCIGFVLETPYGVLGITGDTEYIDSLPEDFEGVDYLVANIVQERSRAGGEAERYSGKLAALHSQFLGELGAEKLLSEVRPKVCFLNHYGDQLATIEDGRVAYKSIPEAIAKRIEKKTKVKTIAALNGARADLGEDIEIDVNRKFFMGSNNF